MNKKPVVAIIAVPIVLIVVTAFVLTSRTDKGERPKDASVDNSDVFIAYKTGKTYEYMANEIDTTLMAEEGHIFIPTRFREKENSLTYEKIDVNTTDYRINPIIEGEEVPQSGLIAYKLIYITNIEPESFVRLFCNGEHICMIPISAKGAEEFHYETIICFKNDGKTHDLYVSAGQGESEHITL